MSDEEKSNELFSLCEQLLNSEASFDDIQRWLDYNKNNQDLLSKAANFIDEKCNFTPLHYLIMKKPQSDLVERILRLAPDSVEIKDNTYGRLPLHWALRSNASDDVTNMLLKAYPQAAGVEDGSGELPLNIAKSLHASDNVIKLLNEAQDQLNTMLPRPTKNSWWNFWDEQIYIENKTEHTLKLIVYYKAEKVEAPEDFEMLHVEPKEKKLLKIKKMYTGIYCDILRNDKFGTSIKLGWAFNYFIKKGYTQEVIGIPKELKQVMGPITVAKRRTLRSESLQDLDVTVPKVIEKSNELKVIISPIVQEREPIAETPGDTIRSKGFQQDVVVSETLKERNELDRYLSSAVIGKQNAVPQSKHEREPAIEDIVEVLELGEALESEYLQDTNDTFTKGFKEQSNLLNSAAVSEVKLAYYFLKKIPSTVNDVDKFFFSLKQELTEGSLSAPHIPQLLVELLKLESYNIDLKTLDESTITAEVEFVLGALLNTCNERLFMNESIAFQNELIAILEKGLDADAENFNKILSYELSVPQTDLPRAAETLGKNQVPDNELTPEAVLTWHILKKVHARNDQGDFFYSLKQELTGGKLSASSLKSLVNELNQIEGQESKWANQNVEALKVDVEFILKALLNTCEERLYMKEIINLQNEVVLEVLNQEVKACENKLTSVPDQTYTDGVAGGKISAGTGTNKTVTAEQTSSAAGSHPAQLSSDISKERNVWNRVLTKLEKAFGLASWIIIKNETAFVLSVNLTERKPEFSTTCMSAGVGVAGNDINFGFQRALNEADPLPDSQFSLETQKLRKCWMDRRARGAYVTCIKHGDSLRKWGPEYVLKGKKHVVDGPPTEAQDKICIENHTDYELHVTIHGEKGTRSVVGPKQADECKRKSFTIQGNSVHVTIKNNACIKLGCGWEDRLLINKGCTHLVEGNPTLRFGRCSHRY